MIKRLKYSPAKTFLMLCALSLFVSSCAIQPYGAAARARSSVFSTPARIQIALVHSPTGTADLLWNGTIHTLMVTLALTGLAPGSIHMAHIHAGTCAAMGQIVYALHPVVADAHGVGSSTTMIAGGMTEIPAHGWAINIHNGPTFATGLEARPISCGNISNVRTMMRGEQSAHAILASAISPNEQVRGIAQVTRMDQIITVILSLSGMVPNSTHMAHIHAGRCSAQGPVLFPLVPVVADALGNAMTVTRITGHTLPPTHWYINVHEAGTMVAMMRPNPIACGDNP